MLQLGMRLSRCGNLKLSSDLRGYTSPVKKDPVKQQDQFPSQFVILKILSDFHHKKHCLYLFIVV